MWSAVIIEVEIAADRTPCLADTVIGPQINLQRLFGYALPARRLHVLQRAHVMQAIGKLHQEHANVAGDRDQQLAEVLRLLRLLGDQIKFF